MTTHIIHHNDLDGYASAGIAKAFLEKQGIHPHFIEMNYGMTLPDVFNQQDTVYMLDFSLQPFSKMYALRESVEKFVWLDHHDSAFKDYAEWHSKGKYESLLGAPMTDPLTSSFCGAERTWIWFKPNGEIPDAIKLVGDWDTWRHAKMVDSKAPFFKMYFDTMVPEGVIEWFYRYTLDTMRPNSGYTTMIKVDEAIQIGTSIKMYEVSESTALMKSRAFEAELVVPFADPRLCSCSNTYAVIAANMGQRGSDRFASVYKPEKHQIMLGFAYENTEKVTVSLYSTNPDIDCGAIAKRCGEAGPFPGGGGHKGAAGFQTSWEFLMGKLLCLCPS
jgi:oligoribonuclease NrnB/cAMP/cGMP phosphodiesterase (DHH superfamily)